MRRKNNRAIWLAITVLLLSTLACTIFVGGPDYPDTSIPVSTQAVLDLQNQITAAVQSGAQGGEVTFQIDQTQLTSYLASRLASQSKPLFTDPQVYLQDGQMEVYGKAERGLLSANVKVTIYVSINEQGQPKIEISAVDFGPLPMPASLREALTATIQEAYTGSLGPIATGFRLEDITIADGVMTVTGRIK
jgi:uncharacterized protein YpmS